MRSDHGDIKYRNLKKEKTKLKNHVKILSDHAKKLPDNVKKLLTQNQILGNNAQEAADSAATRCLSLIARSVVTCRSSSTNRFIAS
jgi:superfamily II helicase